jgi:RimJ/RimL family protein N-acetyltransferase
VISPRPATVADAELISRISLAARPEEPEDPAFVRFQLERPIRPDAVERPTIWEAGGRPVAYTPTGHLPWEVAPERAVWTMLWAPPELTDADLDEILARLVELLGEDEPYVIEYMVWEDEPRLIAAAERLGFRRDRLSKAWELDLSKHGERLLAEREKSRRRMAEQGVELTTLAADGDPQQTRQLQQLINEAQRDTPSTLPIHDETLEEVERWLDSPVVHRDRYWIARDQGRLVAVSYLTYPPRLGNVWTGYTASVRSHRGRGIARAVKMETLGQAVELGVTRVRTDNDEENAPMLHINETLGYHRIPGVLSYLKPLR